MKQQRIISLQAHVRNVLEGYESDREAGRELDIDHAYLSRLASGEKDNPSPEILKKLGLKPEPYFIIGARRDRH